VKIATWNVNSLRPRLQGVAAWVARVQPDVLCLQETKVTDDLFPHAEIEAMGYPNRAVWGQKTYNGVAILSKRPLEDVRIGFQEREPDAQARILSAVVDGIRVVDVYVPNGAEVGSDKFFYKLDWLKRLRAELEGLASPNDPVVLLGDFNIAPTDADVYDPFEHAGQILCSEAERTAWSTLLQWGLVDSWRKKAPFKSEFSWWSYQASGFRKNHGFRIDHLLLSTPLMRRCTSVVIDREPRGVESPSDHAPVVGTFLP
jgi:exodeoxyribonuclease-3